MCDISVVFITKNEAFHISSVIDNVKDFAKEIFVVDSGSSDNTVELAKKAGATVLYHEFLGFGAQWNWALDNCPIKTTWTMKMDPDERLSEKLKQEIETVLLNTPAIGIAFDRVLWFMGHRLSGVKNEIIRIWRTGHCHFSDVNVNEHPIINGGVVKLHGEMEHYDSRDLSHWLMKQNDYTTREAQMRFDGDKLAVEPNFLGNSLERRMWLKRIFFNIPFRYVIHNLILFFFKGAWRSGFNGWRWVKCREMVMRLREYKYLEMKSVKKQSI